MRDTNNAFDHKKERIKYSNHLYKINVSKNNYRLNELFYSTII